ncbi:MAG: hypothetical protein ACREHD_04915 [Pirellulales bacterium]
MSDTHLLTTAEAGDLLRMLPTRVARLAKRGVVPHIALPDGELRYRASDPMEWANQFARPGAHQGVAHVG